MSTRAAPRGVFVLAAAAVVIALVTVGRFDRQALPSGAATPTSTEVPSTPPAPSVVPGGAGSISVANPSQVVVGDGAVWVLSGAVGPTGHTPVLRIAPLADRVTATVWLPAKVDIAGIAAGAGSLWIADYGRGLFRIDPRSTLVSAHVTGIRPIGGPGDDIAVGSSGVWALVQGGVVHVNPVSAQVVALVRLPGTFAAIAAGIDGAWALAADGTLYRIAASDGRVAAVAHVPGKPLQVFVVNQRVWVLALRTPSAAPQSGTPTVLPEALFRIDPASGQVTRTIPLDAVAAFAGQGSIWTLASTVPAGVPAPVTAGIVTVNRVNAVSGKVTATRRTAIVARAGAAGFGSLWLANESGVRRIRIA